MPSLRFKCQDWFEVTCESQVVPRVGEQVRLLERGLTVAYRVQDVTWSFIPSEPNCLIRVDREHVNPCTKCKQTDGVKPIHEPDYSTLSEELIGFECERCNPLLHGFKSLEEYAEHVAFCNNFGH
jgi:hypothetical protein